MQACISRIPWRLEHVHRLGLAGSRGTLTSIFRLEKDLLSRTLIVRDLVLFIELDRVVEGRHV